jgi:ABC-type nickel/cobalt efflux system permease component RcnA
LPWRSLLTLGVSGGILPSPTALIVLLGAISLHRLGFGLLLILFFSLGLATVLTGVGLAFVVARGLIARLPVHARVLHIAPMAGAAGIAVLGVVLATSGALSV